MTIGEEGFVTKMCKELKEKYNIEPGSSKADKFDGMVERACHSVMEKYKAHNVAKQQHNRMMELAGIKETSAPAVQVPEIPELPAQDGDQGDGSKVTTNPDGTKTYAGAFGTFTYDKAGKAVKYSTPSMSGASQTVDLTNQQTTQNYAQGPMNVSQTNDASGKQISSNAQYDLGMMKVAQQKTGDTVTNTVQESDALMAMLKIAGLR